jgi:hypothetical protein
LNKDFSEDDCKAALVRSTNHKNSEMSLVLASELRLEDDADLGRDYKKIIAHLKYQQMREQH